MPQVLLAPTLTNVELDYVADPTLLVAVTNHCPRLRCIRLDLQAWRLVEDPHAVLHFLQTSSSLRHISLTADDYVDSQILRGLAAKPKLRRLDIKMPLDPDILDTANLVSVPDPFAFPALNSLVLGEDVGIHVFTKLLLHFRSIRHLCVRFPRSLKAIPIPIPVEGNPSTTITTFTFQDLSHNLPNLRTLHLQFRSRAIIHLPELLSLALLTKLEELHLTSSVPYFRIPDITDTHFTSLVSALSDLRQLFLYCSQENLTTNSLIALGKSCRSLVVCTIRCLSLDLPVLEDRTCTVSDTPLFPELTDLTVHCLTSPIPPRNYPSSSRHQIETYLDVTEDQDREEDRPSQREQSSHLDHVPEPGPLVIATQVSILTTISKNSLSWALGCG
ncbi:hypothetical protein BJX65DRAFT_188928 [Aspergillus insuetus]